MNKEKAGIIVVIEDDADDREILKSVFSDLDHPNEVMFFEDGFKALAFLESSVDKPLIIISDINLPKLNGFELRDKIRNNSDLNLKCIPYIFFTTSSSQQDVINAYSKSAQGFFIKPPLYSELKRMVGNIINYWMDCTAPNRFF